MRFGRRSFLGFTAGAAAGTALGVPASRTLSDLLASMDPPVYPARGHEDRILSVCRACPGGCGIQARRVGGRVVKLEGNPLHPVNSGGLCPRGQAALQSLNHPDRAPGPLRRTGPRGAIESFQPATWDQALEEIARQLTRLRAENRPESFALVRGESRGLGVRLAVRFLRAFGSPNDIHLQRGAEPESAALRIGTGVGSRPAYDLQRADYLLSFGSGLLEAWNSPVYSMMGFGEFRQGRLGRRGKMVHVESRQSITAAAADEWIAVRPGTEGILALGIAAVLVSEGLFRADFIAAMTTGFEDTRDAQGNPRRGLRRVLTEDFPLDRVSRDTGVPVHVILRLGREFANAHNGLAMGPGRGPLLPGPIQDHLAAHWLNVLMGNLDQPGGLLIPEEAPLPAWPELPSDPVAAAGRRRPRVDGRGKEEISPPRSDPVGLAESIESGSPYPVEVLMFLDSDPVLTHFGPARFAAALERVPLSVSFSNLPDDTALFCDWILPQPHFLETWDLDTRPPGVAYPLVSLARPVVENPLHDVRHPAEVFLDLARRIGPPCAAAFPWSDLPALIRSEVEGLYGTRRGAIMGTQFDEAWVRLMERAGWWAPGYRSAREMWEKMQATGGWWDPFYDHGNWKRILRTESGRYEFRPEFVVPGGADGPGKAASSPAHRSGRESSLHLILFEPLPLSGGTGAELPFLQEILEPGLSARWGTWVEIHPETAGRLGVGEGDRVRVESGHGSLEATARLTPRVVHGVAAMPIGLGKEGGGRWARGVGSNPLRLLSPDRPGQNGDQGIDPTRVRISVTVRGPAGRPHDRS